MKSTNKKGSHVGMMISFVIFIFFVVFLFVIFSPSLTSDNGKGANLDNIEINLLNYFSSNLTSISLRISSSKSFSANCVEFEQLSALADAGVNWNNIIVKNSAGTKIGYDWRETQSSLAASSDKSNRFFRIYASKAISSTESSLSGCDIISTSQYSNGLVRTEKKIFESDIVNALQLYKSDYETLKENAGISADDFGFNFIYENGTVISTGEAPAGAKASTKRISLDYLDSNIDEHIGGMVIKTW